MNFFIQRRKFFLALVGAVLTIVVQYYSNNQLVQAIVPILTALGVHQIPNEPVI